MNLTVVFDNAPGDSRGWIREAARASTLHLVDADKLATALGKNADFVKLMNADGAPSGRGPKAELTPHYRAALKDLTPKGESRLALDGWGWLVYAEKVDAVVLDPGPLAEHVADQVRRRLLPENKAKSQLEELVGQLRKAALKRVGAERLLELKAADTDAQKAAAASAFLKKLK